MPSALAALLGLEIRAENPLPGFTAFLRDKQMLLVFDNCQHVIEAAAALVISILRGTPSVRILATSRGPLRAEGEQVYRLSPLQSPRGSARLTAAEALGFPAVQLFVDRAAQSGSRRNRAHLYRSKRRASAFCWAGIANGGISIV